MMYVLLILSTFDNMSRFAGQIRIDKIKRLTQKVSFFVYKDSI